VEDEGIEEDKYVQQLVDLVLTRMSDKHKSQTDVFRFIDSKGKGKVKKSEFIAAVDKMRISVSKDDATAVFNKIDANGVGYFTY
jgi:Ca2+-binding EF-hand superfamily protein